MITEEQVYKAINSMRGPGRRIGIAATTEKLKNAHMLHERERASIIREAAMDNFYHTIYQKLPQRIKVIIDRHSHLRASKQDEIYYKFLRSLS